MGRHTAEPLRCRSSMMRAPCVENATSDANTSDLNAIGHIAAAVSRQKLLTTLMAFAVVGGSQLSLAADEPESLRPPRQGGVYVIAHRGAHKQIPENTLAAYSRAIDLGADFVEIDLRTTKDGHFVSLHNSTIDAYVTDGSSARVINLTWAQLQAFDIGSRVDKEVEIRENPDSGGDPEAVQRPNRNLRGPEECTHCRSRKDHSEIRHGARGRMVCAPRQSRGHTDGMPCNVFLCLIRNRNRHFG